MTAEAEKTRLEKIRRQIKALPTTPGLYFMKSADETVLYIGKALNLRSRVGSYFQPGVDLVNSRGPKIIEMLAKVKMVDYLETENEVEAILQEARLIKDIRPPYNTDLADDKTFPYMEITTQDDFPGVYITRKPRGRKNKLFGPFAGAKELRQMLVLLQKIFKFRTCNLEIREDDPKKRFFRPCILYSIKQCVAPCAAKVTKKEYSAVVRDLIRFMQSKRSTVLNLLKKQMLQAAKNFEYEKAATLRDRIRLIERLDRRGEVDINVQPEVFAAEPTEALTRLQELCYSSQPIRIIEGIDVANIAGEEAVGSLVKFIDGRPFKSGYRRFKIKSVAGIDDYAMISEVVRRRYKYALEGEELWPDLILIDGGLGHLHAAEAALKSILGNQLAATKVRLASIAKREEEIYFAGSNRQVRLPANDPARKLLQYVRDEAHRFAQHYHHLLRSKKLIGG